MSFETALTGLNAASQDLDVTGNNIANSGTTGFKSSRAEFADIFASAGAGTSGTAIGQGVRLSAVTQEFTQGQFNFTGNGLDLAINGNGFFRLDDGERRPIPGPVRSAWTGTATWPRPTVNTWKDSPRIPPATSTTATSIGCRSIPATSLRIRPVPWPFP